MIALDTGPLIYGVQAQRAAARKAATPETQSLIRRASALIQELQAASKRVMIPAPAAWEFVLDFPVDEQPKVWESLGGFAILPFDEAAARLASGIMRRHFDEVVRTQHGAGRRHAKQSGARAHLKVDIQILAIAIVHRAERLYTTDDISQFTKWADNRIQIAGLPAEQKRLEFD